MNEKRQQIFKWQQQGHIDSGNLEKALAVTDSNNSPKQWYDFINQSILWLGVLSLAFGVIFFFAYNWNAIPKSYKFALIQGLILIAAYIYTQTKDQSHANTAVLFFLALLIGSLFALFGQTYQTGKDPWQLFILWTLFITPLALTSKSSSLWLLWLVLANLTLNLMLGVRYGLFAIMFDHERSILFYAFFNLLAGIAFELFYYSKYKLLKSRVAAQTAIVATMVAFCWASVYSVFEFDKSGFDLLFYLVQMASIYYFYRVKTLDILILSSWVVSGIVFLTCVIARTIDNDFNGASFLLLSLLVIGLSTLAGKWLMKLLREANNKRKKP